MSLVVDLERGNSKIMSKGKLYLKWSPRKAVEVEGQCQMGRTRKGKRNIIKQVRVGKPNAWCLNGYQRYPVTDARIIPAPDFTCMNGAKSFIEARMTIKLKIQINEINNFTKYTY